MVLVFSTCALGTYRALGDGFRIPLSREYDVCVDHWAAGFHVPCFGISAYPTTTRVYRRFFLTAYPRVSPVPPTCRVDIGVWGWLASVVLLGVSAQQLSGDAPALSRCCLGAWNNVSTCINAYAQPYTEQRLLAVECGVLSQFGRQEKAC